VSTQEARPAELEHLRVLRLEPGDVLVLTCPDPLTFERAETLRARVKQEFPGHKVIVIDSGGSLGVVRSDQ
jgi:hypothetical protein